MKPDMALFVMSGFNIPHERIILIERIVNDCAYAFFHNPSFIIHQCPHLWTLIVFANTIPRDMYG